ncbi:unnamed protein product [Adineta steineri]|uniref:Alcohol dehydrogenase n=1 Tax=Adineta steineri TaxID=433720 RepID=A0A814E312_9BILA|nr:unnamed protein product [Adineta steineri]CAF4034919.1 unnamed protein product [Adineta steineri]
MMQAAVLNKFKEPLEIKQVEIPKPGPNDVLIKTIACGVCHTDLHFIRGDWEIFQQFLPRIPGHEGIGEVIEIGSNVDTCIKKGDILGIPWIHETCLQCEYCLSNREEVCPKLIRSGVTVDGCFAEYVLMNANFAIKLPDGMDPYTSAPIYCAGVTMYKALKTSKVQLGQWVSIVGIGGLGSIGIKYAIAMGMKVLAVVAPDDKVAVQLAKDMGAEEVYDGPAEKHGEWIQNKVGGVEASIVTVPLIIAFDQAFVSVKRCGRVIGVGIPKGNMSFPIARWVTSGIELIGSTLGSRQDLQESLDFAKLHGIECKIEKRKLKDINQIFEDMSNYKINGRIVIDFLEK